MTKAWRIAALGLLLIAGCEPARRATDGSQHPLASVRGAETLQPLPPYAKKTPPAGVDQDIETALWRLRAIASDDRTITIRVATSGCIEFDHATAAYEDDAITIAAWNEVWKPKGNFACIAPLWLYEYQVRLGQPVGGSPLLGECTPGDASPDQRQCEALRQAVESSR